MDIKKILDGMDPQTKQKCMIGGVIMGAFLLMSIGISMFSSDPEKMKKSEKADQGEKYKIENPLNSMSPAEGHRARMEQSVENLQKALDQKKAEMELLNQRIEKIEKGVLDDDLNGSEKDESDNENGNDSLEEKNENNDNPFNKITSNLTPSVKSDIENTIQKVLPSSSQSSGDFKGLNDMENPVDSGENFIHLVQENTRKIKTVDNYIPANTHFRAVLLTGIETSTAIGTPQNPNSIVFRVVDDGTLPRGFTSKLKDSKINASCYGEISSERAQCRSVTLTLVEDDGRIIEKNVESTVYGPDGVEGLRGLVIDRFGSIMRANTMIGLASGAANFFQSQIVQKETPGIFGPPNPLSVGDSLKGGLSQGAGSALEKIVDHNIKRSEMISAILKVNGGQVLDLSFKKGFFFDDDDEPEFQSLSANKSQISTDE